MAVEFTPEGPRYVDTKATLAKRKLRRPAPSKFPPPEVQWMLPIHMFQKPMSEWSKDDWLRYIQLQHDQIQYVSSTRNKAIITAVTKAGLTAAEIHRGLLGRISEEGVRKILRNAGMKPSGKRGRKPGVRPPIPRKSGLSHLSE